MISQFLLSYNVQRFPHICTILFFSFFIKLLRSITTDALWRGNKTILVIYQFTRFTQRSARVLHILTQSWKNALQIVFVLFSRYKIWVPTRCLLTSKILLCSVDSCTFALNYLPSKHFELSMVFTLIFKYSLLLQSSVVRVIIGCQLAFFFGFKVQGLEGKFDLERCYSTLLFVAYQL